MRSLTSVVGSFAIACALFGCSSSSTPSTGDGGVADASQADTSEDTSPSTIPDAAEAGPPSCLTLCPKATPTCCENGNSPNFGLCYNLSNTAFCENEGGAP